MSAGRKGKMIEASKGRARIAISVKSTMTTSFAKSAGTQMETLPNARLHYVTKLLIHQATARLAY